jgi:PPOX class probable F420-dependent enzyme
MPNAPVPASVQDFLREPHIAVVATLRSDGSPHTAATWYDWEEGRLLLNMDQSRVRLRHLRSDPRTSITVVDKDDSYRHVTLEGVVVEEHADEGLRDIDRLAIRYTGRRYLTRDSPRFSVWIRVDRWHGWDASGDRKVTDASWGSDASAATGYVGLSRRQPCFQGGSAGCHTVRTRVSVRRSINQRPSTLR